MMSSVGGAHRFPSRARHLCHDGPHHRLEEDRQTLQNYTPHEKIALIGALKKIHHDYGGKEEWSLPDLAGDYHAHIRKAIVLGARLADKYGTGRILSRFGTFASHNSLETSENPPYLPDNAEDKAIDA